MATLVCSAGARNTLGPKDISCHCHGIDGSAKACNESLVEMRQDPLGNTAQEEKKKKYKVCICWAVRFLTSEVLNLFSTVRVTLFVTIMKKNMKEKSLRTSHV